MLDLPGAASGERGVDVPTDTTEWLAQSSRFLLESAPLTGRRLRQQPPVKLVSVAGDARKQVAEAERRVHGTRAVP